VKTLDPTAVQSWCLFRIDGQPYAVALGTVAEIVEAEGLVRLPNGPPRVLGLCAYHRDLVSVVALGAAARPAPGRLVVLILRGEHGSWGLRIDREGTSLAEARCSAPAPGPRAPDEAVVMGALTHGGATHRVIDADATWRDLRDEIETWYQGDGGRGRRDVPTENPT
jgi:chemotaxis signal transduction protein